MARASIFQTILNREEVQQPAKATSDVPSFRNTYEDKLRLIGLHLDQENMRRVHILEVPGGVLARATGGDGVRDELLEFPDNVFENLFEDARNHRDHERTEYLRIKTDLIPTSYSDVLRALGAWLDEGRARSVIISEGANGLYVTGIWLQETSIQSRYAPFDEFFSPQGIDILLTEAHARRG